MPPNKSSRARRQTPIRAVAIILAGIGGAAAGIVLLGNYAAVQELAPGGPVQVFHYVAYLADGDELKLELRGAVDSDTTVSELRIDDSNVPYTIDTGALVAAGKVAHVATAFPFPVGASHEVALVSDSGEAFRALITRPSPSYYVTERLP